MDEGKTIYKNVKSKYETLEWTNRSKDQTKMRNIMKIKSSFSALTYNDLTFFIDIDIKIEICGYVFILLPEEIY